MIARHPLLPLLAALLLGPMLAGCGGSHSDTAAPPDGAGSLNDTAAGGGSGADAAGDAAAAGDSPGATASPDAAWEADGDAGSEAAADAAGDAGPDTAGGGTDASADVAVDPTCEPACGPHGTCVVQGANDAACACEAGYTGAACATDIDECAQAPCLNGGTCVDGVASYVCTCDSAWTGPTCAQPTGVHDPALDGPYAWEELDDTWAASTGNTVAIHCAYPTGAEGPFPVVLFGHGFQLPPSQYFGYLRRLASFGYVAVSVDFVAGLFDANHQRNATELLSGLEWAAAHPTVGLLADTSTAGTSGHSLGGKVALLAATLDARIHATVTLDPVDTAPPGCPPADCPDVSAQMAAIPAAFIGETTDASGGFAACAPAADNFASFYDGAGSPSLRVEALGANHMSFLDDVAGCGLVCAFCNPATADGPTVRSLSRAIMVAFFERHLRGRTGYDTYLTGAEAQTRYVDAGLATIDAK